MLSGFMIQGQIMGTTHILPRTHARIQQKPSEAVPVVTLNDMMVEFPKHHLVTCGLREFAVFE